MLKQEKSRDSKATALKPELKKLFIA